MIYIYSIGKSEGSFKQKAKVYITSKEYGESNQRKELEAVVSLYPGIE